MSDRSNSAQRTRVAADVAEVLALYERFGPDHYDEDLSQLDHAAQTAAMARRDGASDAMVVAALLHDVGHLLELETRGSGEEHLLAEPGVGPGAVGADTAADLAHESVGARYLSSLFGPSVTAPIALHVRAKRYRCAVDPAYHSTLSDGSRRSLLLQGGPMSHDEVAAFEANPSWPDAVALRAWDDGGKVEGAEVADLFSYRDLLASVSARVAGQAGPSDPRS